MASGGHENQSTLGNSMVAASNSSMVGIGYNNVELPSNSKPQKLEKVGTTALRKIVIPKTEPSKLGFRAQFIF